MPREVRRPRRRLVTPGASHRDLRAANGRIAELERENRALRDEVDRLRRNEQAWAQRADDADALIRSLRDALSRAESVTIRQQRSEIALLRDINAALDTALLRSQRENEHLHRVHGPCIRAREISEAAQ